MQISPLEGRLIQTWMRACAVEKAVEIGSLTGYSAIWIARALPPTGQLICLEKNFAQAELVAENVARAGKGNLVRVVAGDARENLVKIKAQGPFDFVFIDADKASYKFYLQWAELNLRPGGLLIADNTRLFGSQHLASPPETVSPKAWHAMREFNARLATSADFTSVFVPTSEGMTVAIKNR